MTALKQQIGTLCEKRLKSAGEFTEFADELISLGVSRQTYDVMDNCLHFYSKEALICSLQANEISKTPKAAPFNVSNKLDKKALQAAIDEFDAGKTSVNAFHEKLAQAGVVYVSAFLDSKVIHYQGQDGTHFTETY